MPSLATKPKDHRNRKMATKRLNKKIDTIERH
jgi:hypothetical protein